ncbi:MAG: hypothetical protein QNJ94_22515 [Alphaproteobacteria bacterium]|nr:hypothetical protein [Alphaproteobacteria bacterium]
MIGRRKTLLCLATMICPLLLAGPAPAASDKGIVWDGSKPAQGVYFYWYEPSFYTGFAPRTQDGSRAHLQLSRGNVVRFTMVLGDAEQESYLETLLLRRDTVQEMIDSKVITLTVNKEFERYVQSLKDKSVAETVAQKASLGAEGYRKKSLEIMSALNPDRIFHIKMPMARVAESWHGVLAAMPADAMETVDGKLDAANAILPGRVNLYALSPALEAALADAAKAAQTEKADSPAFRETAAAFLEQATEGRYPVRGEFVEAHEFTAIYPAGTAKSWTNYKGTKLPNFGVHGVWHLVPRKQGRGITGMVDYLSNNPGYGYISMLAYEPAGGIYYNAIHNAGVRSQLNSARYLPKEWRTVAGERNPKKNYQNLWIGSRGPASHGCTRLPSGHMSEMRDALPSTSKGLESVPFYRNLAQCFDLFDINGDGTLEVMGIKYYLAFWGRKHIPIAAYAPNERKPFYKWLYGSNIAYKEDGSAALKEVPVCRFVGKRKAVEAKVLKDIPMYEAPYARESIQFYKINSTPFTTRKGFELNRELRKVGAGYDLDRSKLLLN